MPTKRIFFFAQIGEQELGSYKVWLSRPIVAVYFLGVIELVRLYEQCIVGHYVY